ncbi:SCAR-like protein 1 [Canna indica]|uniref:Protein SCAR n=1 Tax=Canna indica TaxID=4628 RepID=A0AAQ3L127_9LILI|nr:SCAR-like protein 1 [Canna indica]
MPTIRYQIRNEYGLADPELHQAADKDDPEAILEGVAMAGLVGVLRQLGDLSEFAAEIFRDLHEEVMGMAGRGHGLMLRVQQLEAEFPSVEKSFFSQSSHSNFAYNDGIDWHSNIQIDQSLITQGDMPRFILDSYEECHGPPRLFMLDKFDTAGAGACLKRYSDPSFFRMELVSSGLTQSYIPREKKSRKTRKKGSRWKNGQTLESLLSPRPTTSDPVLDKSATRSVRLKSRNLNGSNGSEGISLRKRLFELHTDGHQLVLDNPRTPSTRNVISVDSAELTSERHESSMGISANHLLARDGSPTKPPAKAVTVLTTFEVDHWKNKNEELSKAQHEPFCEMENPQINFVDKKVKSADSENKSEPTAYNYGHSDPEKSTSLQVEDLTLVGAELKLEGSTDGYRTEDIGSELENFVDALNSMESEAEMDSDIKGRPDVGILTKEACGSGCDSIERLHTLELDSTEISSVAVGLSNISKSEMLNVPLCDTMDNRADMPATEEKVVISSSTANSENSLTETYNESRQELLPHDEVANPADLISDGASIMKVFDNLKSDIQEESCSSCAMNFTSTLSHIDPQGSFDAVQLTASNKNDISAGHKVEAGTDPQGSFDALQLLTVDQNDISVGHKVQLVTDEIAECIDGSSHSGSSYPEEAYDADNADVLILEDMMETLEMPNQQENVSVKYYDSEYLSIRTVPTVKEMQHSDDQDAKAFTSEEDTEASSGGRSILTSRVAFVPDISIDIVKHDGSAADINNGHHDEDLTIERSPDYVKETNDIAQSMNVADSSFDTKDDNISKSPDLMCNPVELMSKEKSFGIDLTDHLADTELESRTLEDFACYIEVPECHSNVTVGKSLQSMSQEAVNSTGTILPPVPAVATISDEGSMMEMANVADAENMAYLTLEVCSENAGMANDNLTMPEIMQGQLDCFIDLEESEEPSEVNSAEETQNLLKMSYAEESQESPKMNSAEVSRELSMVNIAEESQESPKGNSAVESQESSKVKTVENLTPCSENGTYSHSDMNSPIVVLNNLKLPSDINMYNPQKNIQEAQQIVDSKSLSADNFASGDETFNHDLSSPNIQEASHLEDIMLDAAVPCEHPLAFHEAYSPRVETLNSQSNLNMSVSSELEKSALHSSSLCPGLLTKESSNSNDARLLGDIYVTKPVECCQAYPHTSDNETNLDYLVEWEEDDLGSKSLVQGHHEIAVQNLYLSTNLLSVPSSLPEEASTSQASEKVDQEPKSIHQKGEYNEHNMPSLPEEASTSQDSDGVDEETESLHQNGEYFELGIPFNSIDIGDKQSDEPKPICHAFLNNMEYNELGMLPSKTDMTGTQCSEYLVPSGHSSEVCEHHLALNALDKTLPPLPNSDLGFTDSACRLSYQPQSVEPTSCIPSQNPEEPPPPLPPLPPLEWRSRKLQLSSLLPSENSSESLAGTNPFLVLPDIKSANTYMSPSLTLSELSSTAVDQIPQHDALSLKDNIVHSANPSLLPSLEYEKSLCDPGTEGGSKSPLADWVTASPLLENQVTGHSTAQEERVHPIPGKRFQLDQLCPGLELEKSHNSQLSHLHMDKDMPQLQNPLGKSALEDVSDQLTYGDLGGANMHLMKSSELSYSSGLVMPQSSYVYSLAGNQTTLFGVVPTTGDEWFSIKPCSIRNRPRNPLIEAVVAHDRSTLRKVSELARPSNESKEDNKDALLQSNILQLRKVSEVDKPSTKPKSEERDALLEQIRNKSFTLKPAVSSKQNNKGHTTNIKVAAILEKANALRQAVAGSDEEDGGDNWSDC